ncbi:MAG: transketolase [Firmicutes bacterium HGW-Firmicutes-11]|jgi:transketolase|nr:MAG: transketolase [Firmicutes bacterium HGW-Firmicutes-11]
MTIDTYAALEKKCREVRYLTFDAIGTLGVGHLGGSFSAVDALVVLYYRHLRFDPKQPKMEGRDRFVLSKGHAGPALYAILADHGIIDKSELSTLNRHETRLPSHADMNRTPGIDMTTGSLGQGLSCAVGIAVGSKIKKDGARVYCMIGDGESNEGQIWEAAMYAAHMHLDNLIVFTDYNKMQVDGQTKDILGLEPICDKWISFGWNAERVDGHDVKAIDEAIDRAKAIKGKPCMIILDTLKGKGISFIEEIWQNNHNVNVTPVQHEAGLAELAKEGF